MDTMSPLSSKEPKFPIICTSLLLRAKSATFMLDKPTFISMIVSAPYVMEKGVSLVDLLGLVL